MVQSSLNMEKKKWQTGQKISREVSNSVENDLVQSSLFFVFGLRTNSTPTFVALTQ